MPLVLGIGRRPIFRATTRLSAEGSVDADQLLGRGVKADL
jgi:hypothetical protein